MNDRVALRRSQLITTFGPGAMLDLPDRSVIVGGLDWWNMRESGSWHPIHEPRATVLLEQLLRASGRLAEGTSLSLRTPPVDDDRRGQGEPAGVEVRVFPTWFVAQEADAPSGARRRRLVRWRDLDRPARVQVTDDDGRRLPVTPIRFVAGCNKGHLQDIDWTWAVHAGAAERCAQPLWLEEAGTSGDARATRVVCGCGASLSLSEAQVTGRLGTCRGERPWLGSPEPGGCREPLRFLTRTATNAYFPQVLTVISLPLGEDELTRLVASQLDALREATSAADIALARRFNPALRAAIEGWSDAEVFARVERLRMAGGTAERAPKVAEFDLLGSGLEEIGEDAPDARLHARTLAREDWGG